MAKFVVDYSIQGEGGLADADGRLYSSAFERNHRPIIAALQDRLAQLSGDLLEIGSGTGQHALKIAAAFPDLTVWPSDPNPTHVASARAWRQHEGSANLRDAATLDVLDRVWSLNGHAIASSHLSGMLAFNVLHISPWAATIGILVGAGRYLKEDAELLIYGPFSKDGQHIAPSNAAFDADLRASNSEWGVRDISDIEGAAHVFGLEIAELVLLPANNFLLCLRRS